MTIMICGLQVVIYTTHDDLIILLRVLCAANKNNTQNNATHTGYAGRQGRHRRQFLAAPLYHLNFFRSYGRAHDFQEICPSFSFKVKRTRVRFGIFMCSTEFILTLTPRRCNCELLRATFVRTSFLWHSLLNSFYEARIKFTRAHRPVRIYPLESD